MDKVINDIHQVVIDRIYNVFHFTYFGLIFRYCATRKKVIEILSEDCLGESSSDGNNFFYIDPYYIETTTRDQPDLKLEIQSKKNNLRIYISIDYIDDSFKFDYYLTSSCPQCSSYEGCFTVDANLRTISKVKSAKSYLRV